MPDLEISNLTVLPEGSVAATDPLPIVDVSASETKKVTVKALIEAGAALIDDASIPGAKVGTLGTNQVATAAIQNLAITTAKIADGAVTAVKITDATITGAKLVNNTITSTQIAANAIGASELADDAVDTAAIANNAITNVKINNGEIVYAKLNISDGDIPGAKINGNSITSAQIAADAIGSSELADNSVDTAAIVNAAVTGAKIATDTIGSGNIAANAVGASELADNAVDTAAIVSNAITTAKIADDQVTAAKLADNLPGTILATGAIGSTQIAANAITDSELANNAVDAGAIASNAVTEAKIAANAVTTAKIADGTITPAKLNTSNLDRSINVASGNLGINNTVTAATRSGITYNAQGLITGTVALAASDLPLATTSAVGGVSVGAGLTVSGAGALSITNSVTGATVSGITFSNQGLITGATALVAGDLPVATTSAKGAVQITSGGGLTVDGSGGLTTSTSGISAGTYTKVTVNNKGVATAGTVLAAADIPNLAATVLTSGTIDAARIGNDSIDGSKLSNTSTAIFQSIAQSGYPTAQFSGQILFDTVSEDAFIWDGNAWQAITTLTKGSLVFGGTFNANTSKMVSATTAGIAAGLAVGSNLPTPSATTDGVYVVVDVAGTPSAPAPVVSLSPPDYILGVTNSAGSSWNEIDLSQTVAGQVASNITFTPYGQLSSTNVQDALQELETEKMGLAGGTCTGQLLISNTGSIVFEGSTVDAYELTLAVADPTLSDKTITFPDVTGTLITTGDTNTVTSTMVDGSLVNTNIAANASIAFSKLAALTSAQIIVGNGSNVPTAVAVTGDIGINNAGLTSITAGAIVNADISNSAAITGSKVTTGTTSAVGVLQLTDSAASTSTSTAATPAAVKVAKDAADAAATTANAALPKAGGTMTGHLVIDNGKELRLSESDSDGANYTGLKVQAQTGDITLTLPAVAPTANQVLKADASTPTTLTWAADSATDSTKMPLAGGTFTGDVTFTGDSSNGLWDKSASAFVANLTGNVTGNTSGSSGSCTGNAATATALASSVNIGGVAFDGSASINLPGVNTSGTQDTSGTAALATQFTVTANNSTDETVYPLFADGATGSQGAETDTGLTYNPSTGLLTSTGFSGAGTSLTALNASNLSSGTVAAARLGSGSSVTTKFLRGDNTWQTISATPEGTAILSTGESGGTKFLREDGDGTCSWQTVDLTNLNATNLTSGTVPTARLGSGTASSSNFLRGDNSWQTIDLTNLSASNLTSGTVPDARFPSTLPTASGANLTALNASNISSGTIAAARVPTLNQDTTGNAASADTIDTTSSNNNADHYLTFVDSSGSSQGETLRIYSNLKCNPSTGLIEATTFSGSGASLTTLNASNLSSGTIPDARFPSTLPAVSGANLTNLPASAPQITATASGSIAAKDPLIINSSGQATKIVESISQQTPTTSGTTSNIVSSPGAQNGVSICYSASINRYFAVWCRWTDYYAVAKMGTPGTGNSITWGAEITVSNARGYHPVVCFDENAQVPVFAWQTQNNTTSYIRACAINTSTNAMTHGALAQVIYYQYYYNQNLVYNPNAQKVFFGYTSGSDNKVKFRSLSISGSTITLGSYYEPTNDTSYLKGMIYDPDHNVVVAFVRFYAGSYSGGIRSINLSASGTSVTGGSWNTVESNYTVGAMFLASYDEEEGRIVTAYNLSSSSTQIYYRVGFGNASSYSYGGRVTGASGLNLSDGMGFSQYDGIAKRVVLGWNDASYVKAVSIGGSGWTVTQSSVGNVTPGAGSTAYNHSDNGAAYNSSAGGLMLGFADESDNNKPSTRLIISATSSSNLNANNFAGFASNSVSSGSTVTINVVGGTTDWTASTLTPGTYYYVKDDGSLGTSGTANGGLALSSSKLLIK